MTQNEKDLMALNKQISELEKTIDDNDIKALMINRKLKPLYWERKILKKKIRSEKAELKMQVALFTKHPQLKRFSQYVPREGVLQN